MSLSKLFRSFLTLPMLLTMLFPYSLKAAAGPLIAVTLDGRTLPLTQPPISYQGRVLVPLRGIFENLGATVVYDPTTRTINATRGSQQIMLQMGSRQANINGQPSMMDVPPLAMGGRVMVPLRFISEALGTQVSWDAYNHIVNISSLTGGANMPVPNTTYYPPNTTYPSYNNYPPTTTGNFIQRISVTPQSVSLGQAVTVTMIGAPGGSATTTIGSNTQVMTETTPGTYVATYAPTSDLQGRHNDVIVQLRTADGRNQTINDAGALYVTPTGTTTNGAVPLTIGSLSNGTRVAQQFDVIGTTTPYATVRVRALASNNGLLGSILGVQQTVVNQTVQADANGNFTTRIDSGNLASGTAITVLVQSQDANGNLSTEQQFQIYRQ